MSHTPVLIIGGSLVGLSASLFLSWRSVPHVVVEKHSGSALHPRVAGLSPCTGAAIAQDKLEPILRKATVERGADLRLNTELLGFEQVDSHIIARLRNRTNGHEYDLTTRYMIAADGADSAIREALGIDVRW